MTDIKTLFISDCHLGSRHASTGELLEFLTQVKAASIPEKIYIVGDFIDGWKLKRNWYWDNNCNLLIRKILSFSRDGTQVYWVSGNHDEFLRTFIQDFHLINFGNIHIGNEFVYETIREERLLVVHGDMFDMVSQYAKWLCWLGDIGYEILIRASRWTNWVRRRLGLRHWSLSKAIKHNVKQAVNYVSNFEACLVAYAKERGCDGCVCGHIHTAAITQTDGFTYMNCGDWVESCTAIYETADGSFHLYNHPMNH
jgi:UDP-2,3-diacylglucosamine pyrophosphatase LpxH